MAGTRDRRIEVRARCCQPVGLTHCHWLEDLHDVRGPEDSKHIVNNNFMHMYH